MNTADAEEFVASLYATILKRDPLPDEFAHWVGAAATWPPEDIYFAFVNSKEYKLKQAKSAPTTPPPGQGSPSTVGSSQIVNHRWNLPRFGSELSLGEGVENGAIFGPGWSCQDDVCRWMVGTLSVLNISVPSECSDADFILLFRVQPFTANGQIDGQRCAVVCGAEKLAELKLVVPSWIGFRVPAQAVVSGKLAILFVHPDAESPQKFGIAPDSRELAIAVHEAALLPATKADESIGWRGRTGKFVSSDWRAQASLPDWKKIALKFQSMGQNCEFGLVQRQCDAEPLGLLRWCNVSLHALIQCLRSEFSELADGDNLKISTWEDGEYVGRVGDHENFDLLYHTWIPIDQNPNINTVHRNESTRLKMMVRLFIEDLDDGEKVFVLLRKDYLNKEAPLDEFEVLPVISLLRRYNPKAALLWVAVAGTDEKHLVGQCEIIGNNFLKGYIDSLGVPDDLTNTLSLECWKDIMVSALQALGRPIPIHARSRV